jgi:hypothetical protein
VDDGAIESVHSLPVSIVPAAPIRGVGNPGSAGSSTYGCFISTVNTAKASSFIGDWPVSSLCGLLALIGLLWLGNKKVKGKRLKDREAAQGTRRTAQDAWYGERSGTC